LSKIGKVRNIITIAIVIAIVAISAVVLTAGSSDKNPATTYEASYREIGISEPLNNKADRELIGKEIGVVPDLSNLKLAAKLPEDLNDEDYWQEIGFELKTGNRSIPIKIIPEMSNMRSDKLSDGTTLRSGFLTGNISISKNNAREVAITVVEIPAQGKYSFTITIPAYKESPSAVLPFGNLEVNEEMVNIIRGN